MATAADRPAPSRVHLQARRYDRQFFMAMVILLEAVVAIGFAPTYYMAGVFRAPLPSLIVHLHGAIFSSWMILLFMQTVLVSAKRIKLHRTLGLAGFLLACLMPVIAVLTTADFNGKDQVAPAR
jgi:hypothetical protein